MLPVDAHDVLDSLPFEILLGTCLEKLIIATEVVENIFVSVTSAFKKWILAQVVFFLQCLVFVLLKDLKHLHVLVLYSKENWRMSLEVREQTLLWSHLK